MAKDTASVCSTQMDQEKKINLNNWYLLSKAGIQDRE